jgi:hypothetical protein
MGLANGIAFCTGTGAAGLGPAGTPTPGGNGKLLLLAGGTGATMLLFPPGAMKAGGGTTEL